MQILALTLLAVAAFMHAGWNYYAKGARNDLSLQLSYIVLSAIVYLPLSLIALAFFSPHLSAAGLGFALVSSLIHLAYFVLLGQAYARGDLSLVYPLARGTGPLLTVFGAILLLGETPGPLGIGGTFVIVAGIFVMSWSGDLRTRGAATAAIAFALATGAMTATYTLWDKEGVDRLSPVIYSYVIDLGRLCVLAPAVALAGAGASGVIETWREPAQRRAIVAIGLLSPGAYLLVLVALAIAPASYVAPAREVSVLIGALLGVHLLNEANPRRRTAGAVLIVAGIIMLTLS